MKILFVISLITVGTTYLIFSAQNDVKSPEAATKATLSRSFSAQVQGKILNSTSLALLAQGFQAPDKEIRGTSVRFARALLVEWVNQHPPEDWHKDAKTDTLFAKLTNTDDEEFKRFKELNPNSKAIKYLNELAQRKL